MGSRETDVAVELGVTTYSVKLGSNDMAKPDVNEAGRLCQ